MVVDQNNVNRDSEFLNVHNFKLSALCSTFYTPRLLTGVIIDTLRQFYAASELIEEPQLRQFIWTPLDNTNILIEEAINWKPQDTLLRPAILVRRGDLRKPREKRSLGERIQGTPNSFCAIFEGDIGIDCIGNTGAQVELLATDVYKNILQFSDFYKNQLRLSFIDLDSVGQITLVEEAQQYFSVSIKISYSYLEHWTVSLDRIPLREVSINSFMTTN